LPLVPPGQVTPWASPPGQLTPAYRAPSSLLGQVILPAWLMPLATQERSLPETVQLLPGRSRWVRCCHATFQALPPR
jgi:hypothetical protein